MRYNPKDYYIQDESCKGPERRRYDDNGTKYKDYIIYKYVRGEWTRYGAEKNNELIYETDDLNELKGIIDKE